VLRLEVDDSSIPGEAEVVFKHNLERELIITLDRGHRRARYYLLAAQWLEAKTVQRSDRARSSTSLVRARRGRCVAAPARFLGSSHCAATG